MNDNENKELDVVLDNIFVDLIEQRISYSSSVGKANELFSKLTDLDLLKFFCRISRDINCEKCLEENYHWNHPKGKKPVKPKKLEIVEGKKIFLELCPHEPFSHRNKFIWIQSVIQDRIFNILRSGSKEVRDYLEIK